MSGVSISSCILPALDVLGQFNYTPICTEFTILFLQQDKVVIQRLDQLCECVLKGEWPIVSKVADALLQNQLAANSPMSSGYPGIADVDMASLPPGFAVGEDGVPEDPSKAFKLKRVSSN